MNAAALCARERSLGEGCKVLGSGGNTSRELFSSTEMRTCSRVVERMCENLRSDEHHPLWIIRYHSGEDS